MRDICDQNDAVMLADMAHISWVGCGRRRAVALRICGRRDDDDAQVAAGPRGAMIFYRKGAKADGTQYELEDAINFAVFPGLQGGPHNHTIAALATALKQCSEPGLRRVPGAGPREFRVDGQRPHEEGLRSRVGTDNHLVLVDLKNSKKIDGAQRRGRPRKGQHRPEQEHDPRRQVGPVAGRRAHGRAPALTSARLRRGRLRDGRRLVRSRRADRARRQGPGRQARLPPEDRRRARTPRPSRRSRRTCRRSLPASRRWRQVPTPGGVRLSPALTSHLDRTRVVRARRQGRARSDASGWRSWGLRSSTFIAVAGVVVSRRDTAVERVRLASVADRGAVRPAKVAAPSPGLDTAVLLVSSTH